MNDLFAQQRDWDDSAGEARQRLGRARAYLRLLHLAELSDGA